MVIQKCTVDDADYLATLNQQLIQDEQSDNPMTLGELKERMLGFLTTEYTAYYFLEEDQIIGYALVKHTCDPLYLRQFLIERNYRKKYYGKQAFQALLDYLNVKCIDLEVLSVNETGNRFWESCGFQERSRYLRYEDA